MKVQTAENTSHGPAPSEVTTLGAQICHHCPHKSTLQDACVDSTPAASGSRLTTTGQIHIKIDLGTVGSTLNFSEAQFLRL